jgi:aspartate aminotransferase-like enzyme
MHKKLFIPGPVEVHPDILQACAVPMVGHRTKDYEVMHAKAVAGLRAMFDARKGDILLFTSSSTGAMEAALRNLTRKRVLSCSCGAFSERWFEMCAENGKEADPYAVEWGRPTLPDEVDRRLATGRYDLVTVVFNETSTGVMNPLADIAKVVAKYPDVCFAVDAVSAMAGVKIEPETLGIDMVLAGVQKAFGLPPGLAVAYVSDRAYERARTVPARGHYFDLLQMRKYGEKNQTPETPVISLVHALGVQLERMQKEGFDARYARTLEMAKACRAWALERGYALFPEKGFESVTLTCIRNTKGTDIRKLNEELGRRGFVISDGYGKIKDSTFRIAHMADLTMADLGDLLAAIDSILP